MSETNKSVDVNEIWNGWENGSCRHTVHALTCCPVCIKKALAQVEADAIRRERETIESLTKQAVDFRRALKKIQDEKERQGIRDIFWAWATEALNAHPEGGERGE